MQTRIGCVLLVVFGMVLGYGFGSHEKVPVVQAAVAEEPNTDLAEQLHDIKVQVKEINTLLHAGPLKVVVVLNPDT